MTKPIEEIWRVDDRGELVAGDGDDTQAVIWEKNRDAPEYLARVRLAAQAPAMARALVAIEWSGGDVCGTPVCPSCDADQYPANDAPAEHDPECAIDTALRKAGVR